MNERPGRTVVPSDGFQYYRGKYWNDFDIVARQLNERATGRPDVSWPEHLRDHAGPFRRCLVLNCGNGWVERELIEKGVVASAVGVDLSDELLEVARREAIESDLPITYERCDTNLAQFPDDEFDLVVNHAAMHHVAFIDRVMRRLCEMLPSDGVFVSWDYVGPHRNQYTARQWEAAWEANLELPITARQRMRYPDLRTMLRDDPTEAVHSELILPTMQRYFDLEYRRDLGGGVGYLLLTHNDALHALPLDESGALVERVMAADAELTAVAPDQSLFAYAIARPRPGVLDDADRLAAWTAEEEQREATAAANGGVYYPRTAIAALAEPLAGVPVGVDGSVPPEALLARVPGRSLVRVLRIRQRERLGSIVGRLVRRFRRAR